MLRTVLMLTMLLMPCMALAVDEAPAPVGYFQLAYPYPSPDGSRLVFQGNFDGRWQLYELTLESNAIRRLHESRGDDLQPSYSPSGEEVAFVSNRDGNDDVYILNSKSGEVRSLAPHPGKDGHPKWSADGKWIIFNRTLDPNDKEGDVDAAIMRIRADGSELSVISDSPNIETFATLSPNGKSVALVEWIPSGKNRSGDIVVVNIASGKRKNLTHSAEFDAYPFWGPKGEWIYFSTFVANGNGGEKAVLRRVRASDGVIEDLADGAVRAISDKSESILFYNQDADNRVLLFRMPIGKY